MIKEYFKDWNLWDFSWTAIFTTIIIALSLYWHDSIMGITCSLTGIWCVILVAKGRILNYLFGIINVVLYVIISYNSKYYGEVMLNGLYFLPMQFLGYYVWMKHKDNNFIDKIKIKTLSIKQKIYTTLISISGIIGYSFFLKYLKGNLPILDSTSTILSIIACLLMTYRYVEQWILWIIVDVVTIGLWANAFIKTGNDISVLIMWIAYLINAFYGLYAWINMYKNQEREVI